MSGLVNPSDQSCCFRIHNATACLALKEAALTITNAIVTIVLIGSILSFLAMHKKYDLAFINTIPSYIGQAGVYTALAGSGLFALMNLFLIIATVRHYLNKQYSEKEIINSRLKEHIDDNQMQNMLFDNHYTAFIYIMNDQTKEKAYVVVVKEGIYAFKEPEMQASCIRNLESKGFVDSKLSNEFPFEYVSAVLGAANVQNLWNNQLEEIQVENAFSCDVIVDEGVSYYTLVVPNGEVPRFFKSEDARDAAIGEEYAEMINTDDLTRDVKTAIRNDLVFESELDYFIGKVTVDEKDYYYAVARDKILYDVTYAGLIDKIELLGEGSTLSRQWIDENTDFPGANIHVNEKTQFDVATSKNIEIQELKVVYVLAYGTENGTEYFVSPNESLRKQAFSKCEKIDKQQIDAFVDTFRKTKLIDKMLNEGDEFFAGIVLEKNGQYRVVKAADAKFFVHYRKENDAIVSSYTYKFVQINNNVADRLANDTVYPAPLASYLVGKMPNIDADELSLRDREFIYYKDGFETGEEAYPKIYPVILFDRKTSHIAMRIAFKTQEEQKKYAIKLRQIGYLNAVTREEAYKEFCINAVDAVCEAQGDIQGAVSIEFLDKRAHYFVVVQMGQNGLEAEFDYKHTAKAKDIEAEWLNLEMTENEVDFYKNELSSIFAAWEQSLPKDNGRYMMQGFLPYLPFIAYIAGRDEKGVEFVHFFKPTSDQKQAVETEWGHRSSEGFKEPPPSKKVV